MIWLLLSCAQQDSNENFRYTEDLEMEDPEAVEYGRKAKSEAGFRSGGIGGGGTPPPPMQAQEEMEQTQGLSLLSVLGKKGGTISDNLSSLVAATDDAQDTTSVRSWFPESFIFEPLIVTDADGQASYQFTVPDRLTTWRILGLAHNKTGRSSGSIHEILGTLPQYIDPVFPPFLRLGDRVMLPVMASNTTNKRMRSKLKIAVQGGKTKTQVVNVNLPANTSTSIDIPIETTKIGALWIEAKLGEIDAIIDEVDVYPIGTQKRSIESGTLVSRHQFEWQPPKTTLVDTTKLQLSVYPGPIGFFRSELSQSTPQENWQGNAYSIVLAARAQSLFESLGVVGNFKDQQKRIEQRSQMLYLQLMPSIYQDKDDVFSQMDAIEALLAVPDNVEMKRTGQVLANLLADSQRPDGTFGSAKTVQELLVRMAKAAMVFERAAEMDDELLQRSMRVRQLIDRGIPRLWKQNRDAYTAAWLHVAGLGNEKERDEWKRLVRDSAQQEGNQWILNMPEVVVGPEGSKPSTAEFHALGMTVLSDEIELKSSLLSSVLTSYQPGYGWGSPSRNRLILGCLEAVAQQTLPEIITVKVYENDVVLNELVISKEQMNDLIHIEMPIESSSDSTWRLESTPPVANMSFTARFGYYESIKERSEINGLEFKLERPKNVTVNTPTNVPVSVVLPSNSEFELILSFPTGVKLTADSQAMLTNQMSYTVKQTDEALNIAGKMSDKTLLKFNLEVIAQFKGVLSGGAHILKSEQQELVIAPQKWTVE